MTADAPQLWEGCKNNESYYYEAGDADAVEKEFANADHVTTLKMRINRVAPATMEPKGCIGEYDYRDDRYILYAGLQQPHNIRHQLAKRIFKIPAHKVRITAGNVGGSFGLKGGGSPEYHLVLWAAKRVGRPVKWMSDRSEALTTEEHDRDHVSEASLALDSDGNFLALKVENITALGAYLGRSGIVTPTHHLGGLAGTYKTPHILAQVHAVFTNTASTGPYRGSGRPEAAFIMERLIDAAALEMGLDKAELRRRNTVPADAMPFKTGLVYTLDCGDFPRNLEDALSRSDYAGFDTRRQESKARGKLRGIGISNIIEQTSQMNGETVVVRFDPSGAATVFAGSLCHGQGHDTMYKILISDRLGIDADDIRVVDGDTDLLPHGGGTYASRTAALGGTAAAMAADKIIEKATKIAAHMMEAAENDIEFKDGVFSIAGTDKSVALQDVVRTAYAPNKMPKGVEDGLSVPSFYDNFDIEQGRITNDEINRQLLTAINSLLADSISVMKLAV